MGTWAVPGGATEPGPVLVIHENRGLNPYIEDVVRRFAAADFVALGPDALTPPGGYPGNDDDGRAIQRQLDRDVIRAHIYEGANHGFHALTFALSQRAMSFQQSHR